tara:strand:+ start:1866 stop:2027 length:162 start_codon:yes stop_codon:yes gene_type:complete
MEYEKQSIVATITQLDAKLNWGIDIDSLFQKEYKELAEILGDLVTEWNLITTQ